MNPFFAQAARAQMGLPSRSKPAPALEPPELDEFWESENTTPDVAAEEPQDEDPETFALREQAAALLKQAEQKRTGPDKIKLDYEFEQIEPRLRVNHFALLHRFVPAVERIVADMPERAAERLREISDKISDMPIKTAVSYLDTHIEKYGGRNSTKDLSKALVKMESAYRGILAKQNPAYARRIEELDAKMVKYYGSPNGKRQQSLPGHVLFKHAAEKVKR